MTSLPIGAKVRLLRTLAPGNPECTVPLDTVGVVNDDQGYPAGITLVTFPDPYGCWGVGDDDVEEIK